MTIFDLNHVETNSEIKQVKGGDSSRSSASTSNGSASASASTSGGRVATSTSISDVAPLIFTSISTAPNTTMDPSIISIVL